MLTKSNVGHGSKLLKSLNITFFFSFVTKSHFFACANAVLFTSWWRKNGKKYFCKCRFALSSSLKKKKKSKELASPSRSAWWRALTWKWKRPLNKKSPIKDYKICSFSKQWINVFFFLKFMLSFFYDFVTYHVHFMWNKTRKQQQRPSEAID